ncbi:gibberellin 20 oxidase 2-like isoform X2 [Asparagus officinalis]|uniref:gibberellin 20 oxidase 2-like isoform X2 n=1 Tax=Asparagus officinalis TaxID=4686 RepID=UPI00098E3E3E|nr:gibberellin 20 oxidase 2-like isoform X2 [Asparagus officinalis]
MDAKSTSLLLPPPINIADEEKVVFDSNLPRCQVKIPRQFVWPSDERPRTLEELNAPIVDLKGFLQGDDALTDVAADLVRAACTTHGFFQVTNHGIDQGLVRDALDSMYEFFMLPLSHKLRAKRKPGSMWGYAGAHSDRFASKLPWKETLSFGHNGDCTKPAVVDYFTSTLGEEFEHMGIVYQKYCEAMNKLSLFIMELLAISLGVDRHHYRDFFKECSSIMRCNYYPPCQEPELTLGTGPHCDPTSLTILQQDNVEGLEVFVDDKWQSIRPVHGALVINIGDTFMRRNQKEDKELS